MAPMHTTASETRTHIREALGLRNRACEAFFAREAERLAETCRLMSERFLQGGRLLAFGRGASSTDAQHVSVEFVHPVIVGKRALPALDLSAAFAPWIDALLRPEDIVMGFGPPAGDTDVHAALAKADARGAMTLALPALPGASAMTSTTPTTSTVSRASDPLLALSTASTPSALSTNRGSYVMPDASDDPFVHQEIVEMLYHVLWETVHVFFERRELGHDVGDAAFLYPFLGRGDDVWSASSTSCASPSTSDPAREVAASIRMKVADDEALRDRMARDGDETIAEAVRAVRQRIARGGKLILLGNGGSATDANDFALDCVMPPAGYRPIPAVSLSMEPAIATALANDVGADVIFLRQLIAQARPGDVVVAFSTSGASRNIIFALEEARRRGHLTLALLGCDGGEIARQRLADLPIIVPSDYIPRIQEIHASVYHIIRGLLGEIARD